MCRACWPDLDGRPTVELEFHSPNNGVETTRRLLADTGAGSSKSLWDLVLSTDDCLAFGLGEGSATQLGGALVGAFPTYFVEACVPALDAIVLAVAVAVPPALLPPGLAGIAGYRFLARFAYGNSGEDGRFCLRTKRLVARR